LIHQTQTGTGACPHLPALDGVRGLACAIVLACHVTLDGFPGGWVGVDLFFVLSGYLITSILLREYERKGRISLSRFYLRRLLRLTPALLFFLAIYSITPRFNEQPDHPTPVLYALLYITNWVMSLSPGKAGALGHTWSLGVEEQFYLLWPILLVIILGFSLKNRCFVIVVALIGLVLSWRVFLVLNGATAHRTFYGFDTRVDTVLIGCALAIWLSTATPTTHQGIKWVARASPLLLISLVVLIFSLDWNTAAVNSVGFTIIGVWSAAIIVAAIAPGPNMLKTIFNWPPLIALGGISYGVYLWHVPIIHILRDYLQHPISLLFATGVASAGTAAVSYYVIEHPFLRLKLRYSATEPPPPRSDRFRFWHVRHEALGKDRPGRIHQVLCPRR